MTQGTKANRLRKFRKEAGYSQLAVARMIGVTPTQLMEWEKGKRMPSIRFLLKLSVVYHRLIDDMYYELRQEAVQEIIRTKNEQ
jgi:transcriptional regulator with XRE-family HTH domain